VPFTDFCIAFALSFLPDTYSSESLEVIDSIFESTELKLCSLKLPISLTSFTGETTKGMIF
jgi:hypothetical protein